MFSYFCDNLLHMKKKTSTEPLDDIEQLMCKVGSRIREIRKLQNPNYENWCKTHNVISKVSLNHLENGGNAKLYSFLSVLKELGVSLEEFGRDI